MDKFETLDTLTETDLKKFSYQEVCKVIEALSSVRLQDNRSENIIERFDTFISFINIIETRIKINDFKDIKDKNYSNKIDAFKWKLSILKSNLLYMYDINNSLNETQQKAKKVYEDITQQEHDLQLKLSNTLDTLKTSEHDTLTHVLSLMGIFSAVITMIMSVVITSASWLNSANFSSAFIGFAIPNLIALFSVISLMSLVYVFIRRDVVVIHHDGDINLQNTDFAENKKLATKNARTIYKKPRTWVLPMIIITLIVIIALTCAIIALFFIKENNPEHTLYVISASEYDVIEDNKDEAHTNCDCHDSTIPVLNYYEFNLDGKLYRFEYDESLKHDGNLYFCKEHNTLE